MNWVPKFLQPFDVNIGAMVVIWYVAVALSLHRVTHYWLRGRRLAQFGQGVKQLVAWCQHGRLGMIGSNAYDGIHSKLFSAVLHDTSPDASERFADSWLAEDHRVDRWNSRLLGLLITVAPMFGLACTVLGVLRAFTDLGTHGTATLQAIGEPVGLALRATFLGVLCSILCSIVLKSTPLSDLQEHEIKEVEIAWRTLSPVAAVKPAPPQEPRDTNRAEHRVPQRRPAQNSPDSPNCLGKGPQWQD